MEIVLALIASGTVIVVVSVIGSLRFASKIPKKKNVPASNIEYRNTDRSFTIDHDAINAAERMNEQKSLLERERAHWIDRLKQASVYSERERADAEIKRLDKAILEMTVKS